MTVKTLYLKNVTVNGALSLQDGGTPPAAALTATGWTVAKVAANNYSLMAVGTKKASTTFATTDALGTAAFSAASCWRSENPFSGTFANTAWSLAFRIRAATASSQAGAVKCRIWKSTNADGTGATQLTSAALTGSTTAALSTTASATSTVSWTPGSTLTFNNEYLWVQCEWQITTASGSNNGDSLFYIESTAAITTSDFTLATITGTAALSSQASVLAGTADPITVAPSVGALVASAAGMSGSGTTNETFLDANHTDSRVALSNNNLTATTVLGAASGTFFAMGSESRAQRVYCEFHLDHDNHPRGSYMGIGAVQLSHPTNTFIGGANGIGFYSNGDVWMNNVNLWPFDGTGVVFDPGDWIALKIDQIAATAAVRNITKNGAWGPDFDISAINSQTLWPAVETNGA